MAMYRFHRVGFAAARVADVPAECPIRYTRADESCRPQKTPPASLSAERRYPDYSPTKEERKKEHEEYVKGYHAGEEVSLLAVENGCIISKDADITVAFRVELPELFTVTSAEYEAIHSAWYKAIKVLPDYSIVHKQDFFIKENYQPDTERDELSFLSRSFERHFNERPFLNHYCYLFLTKTTRERSRRQSDFSTLCRGRIVPQEIADKGSGKKFIEAVGQFERIMNDSGFVTLTRLAASEITGQDGKAGIIEKYFSLSQTDTTCLKDIGLYPEEMRVGDDILCLHTLSDVEDLPGKVGTDCTV